MESIKSKREYIKAISGILGLAGDIDGDFGIGDIRYADVSLELFGLIGEDDYHTILVYAGEANEEYLKDKNILDDWISIIPENKRESLFKAAVLVVLNDHEFGEKEEEYIYKLAKALGIKKRLVKKTVKSIQFLF